MEWPSKNVSQGGVLHPAKVKYSPETKDFLKLLMEETKLTTMQRNKVNYILRNGEPLKSPKPTRRNFGEPDLPEVTIRPGSSKRRTIDTIIRSGAYEREKFVPEHPKVDREQAIKELQNVLAYGKKDVTPRTCRKPLKQKKNKQKTGEINRFDELVNEIKEREEFLKEMEELGEAHKYKLLIQQQIEARIREMEKLQITPESPKSNTV